MQRSLIILVLFAAVLAVAQPTTTPSFTGMASFNLSRTNVPPGSIGIDSYGTWVANRFKFIIAPPQSSNIGGYADLSSYMGASNIYQTYVDSCSIKVGEMYAFLYGNSTANPWITEPEKLLLHYTVDTAQVAAYTGSDQFDIYEQTGGSWSSGGTTANAVRGVFTLTGSTYFDATQPVYTGGTTVVTDRLLIGNGIPFDTVNVTINSSTATGVSYKYWNGTTFAALTVTDGTSGLTAPGAITFVPPSGWARSVVNGSQSKYWIEIVMTGGSASLNRVYGDNLMTGSLTRGWNDCVGGSGHVNTGTDVEYCGTPAAGSTAKFRQQARVMGYSQTNRFYFNPSNKQSKSGIQTLTVPYLLKYRADNSLWWTGINAVMFDNFGRLPDPPATVSNSHTGTPLSTDFDSATYQVGGVADWTLATAATMAATHILINGSVWDTGNAMYPYQNPPGNPHYMDNSTTLSSFGSENGTQVVSVLSAPSADQLNVCGSIAWCPQGVGSHPMFMTNMILDNINTQLKDGNGSGVSNYHLWDGANRRPMVALATYWIMRTDNVAFIYNTLGTNYYGVGDDYYYFDPPSTATLAGTGLAAQVVSTSSVTFDISQSLATTCSTWEIQCVVRIGGTDIVPVVNFTGTTLTVNINNGNVGITQNHVAGETIEVVSNGHQSQDHPLHRPIFLYGSWFDAMGLDFGTPSNANGFAYPCNGNPYIYANIVGKTPPFQCYWQAGTAITTDGCSGTTCAPLLRRDFSGGLYGNVIVLVRPLDKSNYPTATAEYDTASSPIALGAYYYPLNADGTFGASTNTATLRGGEAGIYVSNTGSAGYFPWH